jgi:hypothetical protein
MNMRFEVFTVVAIIMKFFWVLVPCRLVGRFHSFGDIYCLHLQFTSAPKKEVVCFCEMLASTGQSTQYQNPEEHHHYEI